MGNSPFKHISRDSQFRQLTTGTNHIKVIIDPDISHLYKGMSLNQMIARKIISRDGDTFIITMPDEEQQKKICAILNSERLNFTTK